MRIIIRKSDRKQLMALLKLSPSVVSEALSFKRNSINCRRVRSAAVNLYRGIIV